MIEANAETLSSFLKSKGVSTASQVVANVPAVVPTVEPTTLTQVMQNTSSGLDNITKLMDSVANLIDKGSPLLQGLMKGAQRKAGLEPMPQTLQSVQNGSTNLTVETIKEALRQVLNENNKTPSYNKEELINKLCVMIDNFLIKGNTESPQVTIKDLFESFQKDEVVVKLKAQLNEVL